MSITFEWQDPTKLHDQVMAMLRARGEAIRRVPERAVRRGTFELLKLVQDETPRVTSTLMRSINAVVNRISADVIEGKVGTWLEYARYVEGGTGIYGPRKQPFTITIVARKKKALFWGAYNDKGKPIMARRVQVNVKGMKPRAPFAKALARFLPRYVQIIQQELAREAA